MTKYARYEKMMQARRQQEASLLLQEAPRLWEQIAHLAQARGNACSSAVQAARQDMDGLLRRVDLTLPERGALVLMGLRNLCHELNLTRAHDAPFLDIVGRPDPADTHYGAARINVTFEVASLTPAEYFKTGGESCIAS